ncbi:MAG: hypothetical protein FWD78_07025 [Treponema sp.]|nr:hypothetical protein [Treponema sp.]
MKYFNLLFAVLVLLILSCATPKTAEVSIPAAQTGPQAADISVIAEKPAEKTDTPVPGFSSMIQNRNKEFTDLVFTPELLQIPGYVPGVGIITAASRDKASSLGANEKTILSWAFRDAYTDGLLRNQALTGVLGGDQVHGWPMTDPLSWAQNWQTALQKPNSWGLPSLVLAVADRDIIPADGQCRVFTVQGDILDFYGKGLGINGANGNSGFGSPLGQEFFYNGNIAQRFDNGLIVINDDGTGTFIIDTPPSKVSEDFFLPDVLKGQAPDAVYGAFASAWKIAMDSGMANSMADSMAEGGTLVPDGPIQYVSFNDNPQLRQIISGFETKGFYYLTMNQKSSALVLPDTSALQAQQTQPVLQQGLPAYARFIGSSFLELLTTGLPLAGTEIPAGFTWASGDDFMANMAAGFVIYGLPVTDPVYLISADDHSRIIEQRFSNGWISKGEMRN